ncbi:MAG TPA: sigma-70 family RNA polymerase sigma factor [Gemmataceae bacterium]|nr:sigma-70 family RNA polymerase sigma factor [Gemmataceae bacterium]
MFQRLRQAALAQDGGPSDGELMERFTGRRDTDALETLIRRHGPMALAVCRRVLGNESDAEDAFQAAFLVFVRKAKSIRSRELVGNWLYGVAYRTAMKARGAAARRRMKERRAAIMTPTQTEPEEAWSDLLPLLDRELSRLPDKYRAAIVLCELEGRSRKEAAGKLGVPEGTLSSRLATAKRMLARRLGRHGPTPSDGALAAMLARGTAVSPTLLAAAVKSASLFAAGQAATTVASARVAALAEGVLKSMLLSKLTVAVLAVVAVVATGTLVACRTQAAPPAGPTAPTSAPAPADDKREVNDVKPEWGEAVDGVQARLRPAKTAWNVGDTLEFLLDLRNKGEKTPHQCRVPNFCEMEWDGQWYIYGGSDDLDCKHMFLQPGKEIDEWVRVALDVPWVRKDDKGKRLQVAAGKHTVRVAVLLEDGPRPVSQPVEVEVGEESAWGDADGGVQARLRIPKISWNADETPTFHLDLRNRGKTTPNARRVPFDCQIEVDGTWYSFDLPSGPYPAVGDLLEPGKQVSDWATVSPDKNWGSLNGKTHHFPLAPGKHTIRVAYSLNGEKGAIRPISGPVEIEIGKESAWGGADGDVQARLRAPKAVWNAGEAPAFILDLRTVGKARPDALKILADLEIEVDGTWYWNPNDPDRRVRDILGTYNLAAMEQTTDWVSATADKNWVVKAPAAGKPDHLPPPPGKHTIRVSYEVRSGEKTFRPVTGSVEIEVGKQSDWGKDDGGVQARIRTSKAVSGPKEAPTFVLDLRNVGKETPHSTHIPFDCEIEMDGTWYYYLGPIDVTSPDTPLEPGKQYNDWVKVTPDQLWQEKGPKTAIRQPLLPLSPGKHTIRIAYPLSGAKPPIRPISGPIEIEVRQDG